MMLAQFADLDPIVQVMFLVAALGAMVFVAGLACLVTGLILKRTKVIVTGVVLAGMGMLTTLGMVLAVLGFTTWRY
jgi:hypothetical protein